MPRIDEIVEEFFQIVRDHYDGDDCPVELKEIARAICRNNSTDPDLIVMGGPFWVAQNAGNNAIAIVPRICPAWATYIQDANAALDAIEAMDAKNRS